MKKFANLLEQLLFTYSTNRKIDILATYLKSLNHKEKGITIAVLTGNLNFKNIKRSNILNIIKDKLDWYLFEQSYDYVGDLAETIALIWPSNGISKQRDLNKIGVNIIIYANHLIRSSYPSMLNVAKSILKNGI